MANNKRVRRSAKRALGGVALLGGALIAAGACDRLPFGYTDIAQITRQPAQYEGHDVKVKGTVKDVLKIPLTGTQMYLLQDATGEIMVMPRDTLPSVGARVAVRGVVDSFIIVSGSAAGTRIKETARW